MLDTENSSELHSEAALRPAAPSHHMCVQTATVPRGGGIPAVLSRVGRGKLVTV